MATSDGLGVMAWQGMIEGECRQGVFRIGAVGGYWVYRTSCLIAPFQGAMACACEPGAALALAPGYFIAAPLGLK